MTALFHLRSGRHSTSSDPRDTPVVTRASVDRGSRHVAEATTAQEPAPRIYWALVALALACLAFSKGVRRPNLWSATQAQFDYSHGFIKRGLFGSLVRLVGLDIDHYANFAAISFVILFAWIGALVWTIACTDSRRSVDCAIAAALFFSSIGFTFLVHLVGYLDFVLLLLALATLHVQSFRAKIVVTSGAGVVGVLIHEMYAIVCLMVTISPFLLRLLVAQAEGSGAGRRRDPNLLGAALAAGLVVVVISAMASGRSMSAQQIDALRETILRRTDFPLNGDVFLILGRSFADDLEMMSRYARDNWWWRAQATNALIFLPSTLFFMLVSARLVHQRIAGWHRSAGMLVVIVASLAPLALNVFGSDMARWYALTVVTSFIVLTICVRELALPKRAFALTTGLRSAAIVLMGVNLAAGTALYDRYAIELWPFAEHWGFWLRWDLTPPPR